jgi:hypothetical protein
MHRVMLFLFCCARADDLESLIVREFETLTVEMKLSPFGSRPNSRIAVKSHLDFFAIFIYLLSHHSTLNNLIKFGMCSQSSLGYHNTSTTATQEELSPRRDKLAMVVEDDRSDHLALQNHPRAGPGRDG